VSEYQYYEFRALDRRLTAEQQRRLRSLSSRAEISATRFTNEYSFGDFRGDPGRLLEEYFDAYLYAANWGTRELAFRLPWALLDAETARRYCDEEYRAWVTETAEHVIVRFRWDDDEGNDWIEGEGLLDPLLAARSELAAGDQRLLYLGWLLKVQLGGPDEDDEDLEDEVEPPVPAGLRELSDSLASVAEFLKIDDDLIEVAAEASGPLVLVSDDGIADWVTALPAGEKDNRTFSDRSPRVRARLRACCTVHSPVGFAVTPPRCIRRVPCSMNTRTYSLFSSTVSTCRKSTAVDPAVAPQRILFRNADDKAGDATN
jgi:hypothetical protein